jgi:hypothetical protein
MLLVACLMAALMTGTTVAEAEAAPKRHKKLESFALSLVNCTRTGGWVRADGTCKHKGTGRHSPWVKPLRLHHGISADVAFPWAVRIARAGLCGHSYWGSSIGDRYTAAGYMHRRTGESVGCSGYYKARRMVIRTHRRFQQERATNGWHWRNIKNPDWRSVGIGVATVGNETRVVYNFYGGRAPKP